MQVVPDFIIETRPQTDRVRRLKRKMADTRMKKGARPGWRTDPFAEKVYIYRGTQAQETVEGFDGRMLSGETGQPGFEMPLEEFKVKKR